MSASGSETLANIPDYLACGNGGDLSRAAIAVGYKRHECLRLLQRDMRRQWYDIGFSLSLEHHRLISGE